MTGKSLRILGSAVLMIAALYPAAGIEGSDPLPISLFKDETCQVDKSRIGYQGKGLTLALIS